MNEAQQFRKPAPFGPGTMPHPDDHVTWGEALQGLNPVGWPPWEQVFWQSLAKNMADTAKGIPQLPSIAWSLVKEIPNLRKAPGIFAGTMGEGTEFVSRLEKAGMPTFAALAGDYIERYGSLEGFKTTLATDPVSIIADVVGLVPGVGGAKAAQTTGRLGKIVRAMQKTANVADDVINIAGTGVQKAAGAGARRIQKSFAMDPSKYNIPIEVRTGRFDEATGRAMTEMITPRELAQKLSEISGTEITPDDLPIQALTDNEIPITFEEVLRKTEEDIAPKIAAEYDAASEMVQGAQSELVAKYPTKFKKYWNPSSVGEFLQEQYMKTQRGEKGRIGNLFEQNQADLDVELPRVDSGKVGKFEFGEQTTFVDLNKTQTIRQALPRTEALIEELLEKYDGKIENVTNPDIKASVEAYYRIAETLSGMDKITYNTLRTLRTDFGDNVNLFAREGKILKTGEGSVSKRVYNRITQDIFDQLEAAAEANPGAFPDDMVTRVKAANAEWRDWLQLEDTEAAKWLRSNVDDPGGMLDKLLSKSNSLVDTEIGNLKRLVGDEWSTFQKSLLNRLLDRSMRGDDVTPAGLKTQLENINHKNKNQLTQLFGEDTAKILNEVATFRQRTFGPKGQWNTPYAMEIIQKHLRDPDFTNLLFATGMMSDATAQAIHGATTATGKVVDIPGVQLATALNLIYAGASYFPKRAAKQKLVSGGYREWMTSGYEYKYQIPGGKGEITINAETFQVVEELIDKHGGKLFYPGRVAARTARQKKEREQRVDLDRVDPLRQNLRQ